MNELAKKVSDSFQKRFGSVPLIFYSPGRINFIGEHIDYNDGFVMPAAINKGIYYAVKENNTDAINFFAIDFNEELSIKISEIKKSESWKNYVLSVINEFLLLKKKVKGFDCVFGGNIANGAGMSSSAAVEGGLAYAVNEMNNYNLDRRELALLCQRAEHNYPGVKCGIMDQYANMFGKKDHVILLDCKTIENKYFPLHLDNLHVVLINSKVHHSLATSAYNERRKQCEEGLSILNKEIGIKSFRDIKNLSDLDQVKIKMPEIVYKRCKYVIEEILRTQKAGLFLQQNNLLEFGKLMFQTHYGLRDLYEVSCNELDFLVDEAENNLSVIGSRLMGGGFGGCTINLVKKDEGRAFVTSITTAYQKKFHLHPEFYEVQLSDGTHQVS